MEDPDLQVVGTIIVVDMAELSILQQARLVSPSLAWHLTMVIQVRTAYIQDLQVVWSEHSRAPQSESLLPLDKKHHMAKVSITVVTK